MNVTLHTCVHCTLAIRRCSQIIYLVSFIYLLRLACVWESQCIYAVRAHCGAHSPNTVLSEKNPSGKLPISKKQQHIFVKIFGWNAIANVFFKCLISLACFLWCVRELCTGKVFSNWLKLAIHMKFLGCISIGPIVFVFATFHFARYD